MLQRGIKSLIKPYLFRSNICSIAFNKHKPYINKNINKNKNKKSLYLLGLFGIASLKHYCYNDEKRLKEENSKKIIFEKELKTDNNPKFKIILKLYNLINSKKNIDITEIQELIKKYLCFELNYLFINRIKLSPNDQLKLDSIIDRLINIYDYIKYDIMFYFDIINKKIYFSFGITDNMMQKYKETSKYIFENINTTEFFTTLYFLNKKYTFMPEYIIIYILDKYLYWSLNYNFEKDVLLLDKYKFAYLILYDFINTNVINKEISKSKIILQKKYLGENSKYIDMKKEPINTDNLYLYFSFNIDANQDKHRLNYFYYTLFYIYNN